MIDWGKGLSSRCYATLVNPSTWNDEEKIQILNASISKNSTDELLESATLTCTNFDNSKEYWLRLYIEASQNNDNVRVPVFTGMATSPSNSIDGNRVQYSVQCYSVLKPVKDVILPKGWFAPSDFNAGTILSELLEPTPAKVEITDGIPDLKSNIIAEDSETNMSMVSKIIDAIDWRIVIDGNGTIQIKPHANSISTEFGNMYNDVLEPSISIDYDWYQCPNVLMVIDGSNTYTERDTSVDSIYSIPNRGREIWMVDSSPSRYEGESLEDYAQRKLEEEQNTYLQVTYTRRFFPDLNMGDIVRLKYPEQNLTGIYKIKSQSISLGYGATVSEVVEYYGG